MTIEDADTPELQAIAERARRRHRRWAVGVIVCGLAAGVLGGFLATIIGHRHHREHHHGSALVLVVVIAAVAVLLVAEGAVIYWLIGRKGFFKTSLLFGLPYRDRRAVMKALRRGQPPQDATLRAVGVRVAERTLRYRKLTMGLYLVVALVEGVNVLIPDRPAWTRILAAAAVVVLMLLPFYQRALVRGARRYLQRTAGTDSAQPS